MTCGPAHAHWAARRPCDWASAEHEAVDPSASTSTPHNSSAAQRAWTTTGCCAGRGNKKKKHSGPKHGGCIGPRGHTFIGILSTKPRENSHGSALRGPARSASMRESRAARSLFRLKRQARLRYVKLVERQQSQASSTQVGLQKPGSPLPHLPLTLVQCCKQTFLLGDTPGRPVWRTNGFELSASLAKNLARKGQTQRDCALGPLAKPFTG